MTTPATPSNQTPLIPEGILTAVQTLAGTSAIALVNTGDRSLNAAISAFITTIVVYIIEKIKKFQKWSEFNDLWKKLIDDLPIWKKKGQEKEKSLDPLDVSEAPECKHMPFSLHFTTVVTVTPFLLWLSKFQPNVYYRSTSRGIDINDAGKIIIIPESSSLFVTRMKDLPLIEKYKPIYHNIRYNAYVYIASYDVDDRFFIISTNIKNQSVLEEFVAVVNEWTRTQAIKREFRIEDPSISRTLYRVKLNLNQGMSTQGLPSPYTKQQRLVSRSFDGLFFEQKDVLLDSLHKFKAGTMYPKHLREDNKLGILMHGPPGTGKSACMCAIAEMLQKDLMPVDGPTMRSRSQMDRIFACTDVIIAFDEFDCLLDVVGKRGGDEEEDEEGGAGKGGRKGKGRGGEAGHSLKADMAAKVFMAAMDEKDDAKKAALMKQYETLTGSTSDKVDMAYLLSKFQGYESAEGRCIVASTNAPHLIDDALKRKGRFDLVLHLDNATPQMILDIVCYYYQTEEAEKAALTEEFAHLLPVRQIAPATVQDIAMNSESAREAIGKMLPCLR